MTIEVSNTMDVSYYYKLSDSVGKGDKTKVELLLGGKKLQGTDAYDILHTAVETGKENIIQLLLDHGADINFSNTYREHLLIAAIEAKDIGMVTLLLKFKANPNIQDQSKFTPLHRASKHEPKNNDIFIPIVKLLLSSGANVNSSNMFGDLPIHDAVNKNNKAMVELLLESGAEINIQNKTGDTPLHTAAQKGFVDMIKLLVKHGANIYIKNSSKHTPLAVAYDYNKLDAMPILLNLGAKISEIDNFVPKPTPCYSISMRPIQTGWHPNHRFINEEEYNEHGWDNQYRNKYSFDHY